MPRRYFVPLPPLRAGFVVYDERVLADDVHRAATLRLGRARRRSLDLVRENGRIRIDGAWWTLLLRHRAPVGYLPPNVADTVLASGMLGIVVPRFLSTLVNEEEGWIHLLLQITGPGSDLAAYREAGQTLPRTPPPDFTEQAPAGCPRSRESGTRF